MRYSNLGRAVRALLVAVLMIPLSACSSWNDVEDCLVETWDPIAIVSPAILAGCFLPELTTAPAVQSLEGRYELKTIAGYALPATGVFAFQYQAGSVELRGDATFVDVIQIAGVVDSLRGTYALDGDSVRFTSVGYGAYAARWDPHGALAARWAEGEFVYRKEP